MTQNSKTALFEKLVPILLVLSVGLAFMVGVLWQKVSSLENGGTGAKTTLNNAAAPAAPEVTLDTIKGLFDKNVIKFGDASKKLIAVEVADPSCPWCHVAGGENPEILSQMGVAAGYKAPVTELRKLVDEGKASFIWLYYPGHGNGEMGTKAMYCANEVGKFWEVHDVLMTNAGYDMLNTTVQNDKAKSQTLADFLKSAMDPVAMKKCLDSGKYDGRLNEDAQIAASLGTSGTPGFFLNTTSFPGAVDYSKMQPAVDAALK
jgi:protein-disulfide isomerase